MRKAKSVTTIRMVVVVTLQLNNVTTQMMKRKYYMKSIEWHQRSFIQMYQGMIDIVR